jgi:hypothetical protein
MGVDDDAAFSDSLSFGMRFRRLSRRQIVLLPASRKECQCKSSAYVKSSHFFRDRLPVEKVGDCNHSECSEVHLEDDTGALAFFSGAAR